MMAAKTSRLLVLGLAATMLSGCSALRAHKGVVLDTQLATTIQPGVDNKASVEKLLGRPSFTGQFTPNDWYYISRDTTQFAFRNPRVSKQTVMLVRFDPAGNVTQVQRSGKEAILAFDPSGRRTPTLGRKRGFFEELFSNIGAFGSTSSTTSQ